MIKSPVRAAILSVVLLASPAFAQAPLPDDLRDLSLEELMNTEVVSSTQTFVRLPETPSTTYVVTGDQIRRWGIRRLSELVDRLIPGAFAAEDVDDMILSFRGITADNNLKVLLLLNGHDYNTVWNNGPSSEVELGLMDDIKRVEVLIGPHTALYGSGALLGVINIIMRSGKDFNGIRATGNYGTGDYKKADLIAGGQLNSDLDYFFSMGGLSANGYDNNNNSPLNISRFPLSYRVYSEINYKDFQFMTRFTRSSRDFYDQVVRATKSNRWTNYDTFFVDAQRKFEINPNFKSTLNLTYDSIQTQRHDFTLGTKLRAVGEDRYGIKYTSFYSGIKGHEIVLGLNYRRDEFGPDWDGDNFDFETEIVDGEVTGIPTDQYSKRTLTPYGRNVYALFGQDSIRLNDRYSLLLGFRYDRIEAPKIPHPDSFAPRVALVIKPNPKTVLKAMFTYGLSRQINAAVTSPDNFAFGSPNFNQIVNPEHMYSYEVSASNQIKSYFGISANIYYNSIRDLFGVDPIRSTKNFTILTSAGAVDYVGFEITAAINPTPDSLFRFTHQHVQFGHTVNDVLGVLTTFDGNHLNNYPGDITKLLADYKISRDFSANMNANLVWNNIGNMQKAKSEDPGIVKETRFYSIVNANLNWDVTPRVHMIFSIYNIFDVQKSVPPFTPTSFMAERNANISISFQP